MICKTHKKNQERGFVATKIRASPRHRSEVRRPRAHARRGRKILIIERGVYRNTWFIGGIYSKKRKEDLNICQICSHQPYHPFLQPSNISFSHPHSIAFTFIPQHFISQNTTHRHNM